jgi:hypothetical protein
MDSLVPPARRHLVWSIAAIPSQLTGRFLTGLKDCSQGPVAISFTSGTHTEVAVVTLNDFDWAITQSHAILCFHSLFHYLWLCGSVSSAEHLDPLIEGVQRLAPQYRKGKPGNLHMRRVLEFFRLLFVSLQTRVGIIRAYRRTGLLFGGLLSGEHQNIIAISKKLDIAYSSKQTGERNFAR